MGTYAQISDVEDFIEGWVTDDPVALERLIARAERDVDNLFGQLIPDETTGLKVDVTTLSVQEAKALARAVAAQVEHRFTVGEAALRGETAGALKRVKGPDFEKEYAVSSGPPRRYSPKLRDELAPLNYLRITGARAAA